MEIYTTDKLPTISIIGPGKVGTAVGILAAQRGCTVNAVGGRRPQKVATAAWSIGPHVQALSIEQAAQSAELILLCVSDDAIQQVARDLARQRAFAPGTILAHLSGALSSEVLKDAQKLCQCSVASMHPLQTFPTVETAVSMIQGAWCFYEGDDKAVSVLEQLARIIGMKPYRIEKKAKTLYHASAVTACNYFIALMDAALALAEHAGIDRSTAWSALEVLIKSAHKNIEILGTKNALTGPIARGDIDTVKRHLKQLAHTTDDLDDLYRTLGSYTVTMAVQKGTLHHEKALQIIELLKKSHTLLPANSTNKK